MKFFDTVKIWGAANTERIRREQVPTNAPADLVLSGIRGEVDSGQIILTSIRDYVITRFGVRMSDLVSEDGAVIPASSAAFFLEKYIKIWNPSWEKTSARTVPMIAGEYPDALVPFDAAERANEALLLPNLNQGIWVDVAIPADAKKGTYRGKVIFSIGEETAEVPVSLRVYNADMPEKIHAHSMYAIWYDLIETGEGKSGLEIEEKYFDYLLKNRIEPTAIPYSGYKTYEEFADYAVKYVKNKKLGYYRIPSYVTKEGERFVVNREKTEEILVALAEKQKTLRAAGDTETDLFKKAFWYTIDEPDYTGRMDDVPEAEKTLVRAKEAVAARYPEFSDSILKVKHVMVTQFLHPDRAGSDEEGGVQTWCVQLHQFDSEARYEVGGRNMSGREFVQWRKSNPDCKKAGEDVWFYHCNQPENPYPTDMIDDNLIACRLMCWMQYELDIAGILSWSVNYYQKYWEVGPTARNVWEDSVTMGISNGDGQILYPGARYHVDGPIGSLRLAAFRAGKQDYEYFYLLEKLLEKAGGGISAREIVASLLRPLVKNDVIPVIDGRENATFKEARRKLSELLENLNENGKAALSAAKTLVSGN